jgi:hypothetical protein
VIVLEPQLTVAGTMSDRGPVLGEAFVSEMEDRSNTAQKGVAFIITQETA